MELGQEVLRTPEGTPINQEVLEEMIWFFRVEDAAPWNYSILGLTVVVVVISMVLLGKSIQANRNRKRQSQEKETPEAQYLRDAGDKENNSLNNLREIPTSGKPDLALVGIELNEKDEPQVYLPEPQETES